MQRATVDAPKREERAGARAAIAALPPPRHDQAVRLTASGFGETGKPDTTYERSQQETRARPPAAASAPSNGAAEVAALAPPPLDVPPLGVEAIGLDALPTDSIAVPQLDAIAPIDVAPLPADDGRPSGRAGRTDSNRLTDTDSTRTTSTTD